MRGLRAKSAKPGVKILNQQQQSKELKDAQANLEQSKIQNHKLKIKEISGNIIKKKIINVNKLAENKQYSRIMPKFIVHDKQQLYSEVMKLKQIQNNLLEENTKLKTKILILERQKQRMSKNCDIQINHRAKMYSTGSQMQQTTVITGMKKLLRQARDEIYVLTNQIKNTKKTIKYTKISELQVQISYYIEQINKLNDKIKQILEKKQQSHNNKKKMQEIEQYLVNVQKQRETYIANYKKIFQQKAQLQDNLKVVTNKNTKIIKDLEISKRSNIIAQKQLQNIKLQLIKLKQQNIKHQTKINNKNIPEKKKNSHDEQQMLVKKKSYQQFDTLKKKYGELQIKYQQLIKSQQKSKIESQSNKIVSNQKNQQYNEDFQQQKNIQTQQHQQNQQKQNQQSNNQTKQAPKKKSKKSKQQQKVKTQQKNLTLASLKLLLTFRMKGQRYPFKQLEQDILEAGQKFFKLFQIRSMLQNSPFFFNKNQTNIIIEYFYEKNQIDLNASLPIQTMIKKLRTLIQDFEQISDDTQQQMFLGISQMVTTYATQLQVAFNQKRNGQQTISLENIIHLFKQLQLPDPYIDMIISQLSLVSEDLDHLNYIQFFKRFYIDEEENDQQENSKFNQNRVHRNMIKQQQFQQSQEEKRSKVKLEPNPNQKSREKVYLTEHDEQIQH